MSTVAAASEEHWEQVYASRRADEVSWFEATPDVSLRLIRTVLPRQASVLDVGAGASALVDSLVAGGVTDVTVLDISGRALELVRERLGRPSTHVTFVHADVLAWEPGRMFDVWHDRAVFHFLVSPESRARYVRLAKSAIPRGGSLVAATFAPDGPTHCSGLPVCRYDEAGMETEFGPGFELLHSERAEHVTPSGVVQPFTWVVLRRR